MNNFRFFQNSNCEFFPCHKNIDSENFNCLFCFCPLYFINNCGGNPTLTENGIKDCSNCTLPHVNYDNVIQRIRKEIIHRKGVKDCDIFSVQGHIGHFIGTITSEANARLIAAAPEMYELLKFFCEDKAIDEDRFDDYLAAIFEAKKLFARIDGKEEIIAHEGTN